MRVHTLVAVAVLCFAGTAAQAQPAPGQAGHGVDLGLSYDYLHANAPSGGCGCFSLKGASASAGVRVKPYLTLAFDASGSHANGLLGSNESLTLLTFLAGPRYISHLHRTRITLFGQTLFGVAHTSSNFIYNEGGSGFALLAGGGLDVTLGRRFSLRATEVDYVLTRVPNGATNIQNNVRITSGLVFRLR